jgi:hypothetical protein
MSIALVAHTIWTPGSTGGTSDAIDTTGADLLILCASIYAGGSTSTPTDSKGNTWTPLTVQTNSGSSRNRLFYAEAPIVGTGHTFTYNAANIFPTFTVAAFSGTKQSGVFDVENGAFSASNITSFQTGSVTPGEDNELIVTGITVDGEGLDNASIDGGFTITDYAKAVSGLRVGGGLAYLIQSGAAAANPTWSWTTNQAPAATIATFKQAAAAPGAKSLAALGVG